jgi:hypothetical protein
MLDSVCFHNLVTYAQRLQDLYSACLMFSMRTHTGPRFIISSEGRERCDTNANVGQVLEGVCSFKFHVERCVGGEERKENAKPFLCRCFYSIHIKECSSALFTTKHTTRVPGVPTGRSGHKAKPQLSSSVDTPITTCTPSQLHGVITQSILPPPPHTHKHTSVLLNSYPQITSIPSVLLVTLNWPLRLSLCLRRWAVFASLTPGRLSTRGYQRCLQKINGNGFSAVWR